MTLKNGFGKWSLFINLLLIINLFYHPVDEKIKGWTLRFPAKENPNMEKSLFNWPIVLQYDVKTKYRLVSRKFFGREVFSGERSRVCIRSTNQSNRSISVRLLFLFCWRVFISRSYENRSKALKRYNKSNSEGVGVKKGPMSGGLVNIIGFLFFCCLQEQSNSVNTDTDGAIENVRIKRVEIRSVRDSANSPWWWGVRIKWVSVLSGVWLWIMPVTREGGCGVVGLTVCSLCIG